MLPDKKYENMERYINLEMTDEERTTFELEIDTNEELAKAVALYKDIPNQLQNITADLDFNQKLKNARNNFSEPSTPKSNPLWWILSMFLLAVVVYFGYRQINVVTPVQEETAPNEEQQIDLPAGVPIAYLWENTEKPASLTTRSGDAISDDEQKYEAAFTKYSEKEYQGAIQILNTIEASSTVLDKALLLKGVSQFEEGKITDAITTYNAYLANENYPKDMALWYQALAYLKNNQNDAAKTNLQIIIDEDYSKADLAKILLERI